MSKTELMEGQLDENEEKKSLKHPNSTDDETSVEEPLLKRGRSTENTSPGSRDSSVSSTTSIRSTSSTRLKRYICADCGKSYNRPSLLQQHLLSHTGDKPFKCDVCEEAFSRKYHLERHKLKHLSTEEKPFHCAICSKGCNTIQHLKRHEKVHEKSFKCEHCEETFFKHQTLKHHISSVHLQNRLICEYCNKEFKRPYRLENHKLKLHNESPGYQCTFPGCFKNFQTWRGLTVHMKSDHPKLECKICGKGCIGLTGLEMHMKVHDTEQVVKLWKCDQCSSSHLKKDDLVKHQTETHLKDNGTETEIETELEKLVNEGKCFVPPKAAPASKVFVKLPEGLTVESVTEMISENVDQRTIPCKYKSCNRLFKKQFDLDRHLKWHAKLDLQLTEKIKSLKGE